MTSAIERQLVAASALHREGRFDEAERLCRDSLRQQESAAGHAVLGSVLAAKQRLDEAVAAFHRALAIEPANVMALNNLGRVLRRQGDLAGAVKAFAASVHHAPGVMVARTNLASTLAQSGRLELALAEAEEATRRHPKQSEPFWVLADIQLKRRELDAARAAIDRGLALDPERAELHSTKAAVEKAVGEIDASLAAARRALALKTLPQLHSTLLMAMQYAPSASAQEIFEGHRLWHESFAAEIAPARDWPGIDFTPDRRLRVGFLSGDFRRCSTPFLLLPLLEHRPRDDWELTCYANSRHRDDFTALIRDRTERWRMIADRSDDEVAAMVRDDRIDILFDLNGHTFGNRLLVFARKPAPLQVSWLDYVATTGLPAIDYQFGDAIHTPHDEQSLYVSRIKHLPDDYIRYWAPPEAPDVGPLPARQNGFVTFGCFNAAYKISDAALAAWAAILARVPDARLLLSTKEFAAEATRRRFRQRLADLGVADERLRFLGGSADHASFLAQYNQIDIALDSLPYSGGLTTCEALYMGVPVVTYPGTRFCSRHSACHLRAAGLETWVAPDRDAMIDLAAAKAADLDSLEKLRAGLRRHMEASTLMDGVGFARGFTALLREIWGEACDRHDSMSPS